MTAYVYHDISDADYHADPCPELHGCPSLSSTLARKLLATSPAVAQHDHPRLGAGVHRAAWKDQKPGMRMGAMLHAELLGSGPDFVVIPDYAKDKEEFARDKHCYARDWKKKESRRLRDEALSVGQFPVLHHERPQIEALAAILAPALVARGVQLLDGHRETTIIWSRETEYGPVYMRARLDHYCFAGRILHTDIKKTRDASRDVLAKACCTLGYHVQQAAYEDALVAAYPEWEGRIESRLAFLQIDPVPDVRMVELDSTFREIGRRKWLEAISLWAECMHNDHWPGYPPETITIEAPGWYVAREGNL